MADRVYFMENATGVIRRTDDDLIYFEADSTPVEIYYGKSTKGTLATLTEEIILTTFSQSTGNVGSPSGRTYTFTTPITAYFYWLVLITPGLNDVQTATGPNIPNDGAKVIDYVLDISDEFPIAFYARSNEFDYRQMDPHYSSQVVNYGIKVIRGSYYRAYRLNPPGGSGSINTKIVYSF